MDLRSYDPAIGRFNGIDPVTHHSQGTSVAFDNNPIFFADPSGADSKWGALWLLNASLGGDPNDREWEDEYYANKEDEEEEKNVTIEAGPLEIQDNKAKAQSYLNDIKKFLKRFAYNNAAKVISSKNKGKVYNVGAPATMELNSFYAKPFFAKDEGTIFSENLVRGFEKKTNLEGYGRVTIIYKAGLKIDDFNASADFIKGINTLYGSPLELRVNDRNVGFILFESVKIRDKFVEDYYYSHYNEAKDILENGNFKTNPTKLKD